MQLSIIIPVYNADKFLSACIDSVLNISVEDFEIILINDGSTDNSLKIIESYKNKYPDIIKTFNQKNLGLSAARNKGIDLSNGKYISFIDSDDIIYSNKFDIFFSNVLKDDVDIGVAELERDFNGTIKYDYYPKRKTKKIINKGIMNGQEYLKNTFDYSNNEIKVEAVTKIYNRDYLLKNGIYFEDKLLHEDTLFYMTNIIYAKKIKYYDISFYKYYMRSESIMHNIKKQNYLDIFKISKKLIDNIENIKDCKLAYNSIIINLLFEIYKFDKNLFRDDIINMVKKIKFITIKAFIKKIIINTGWFYEK